MVDLSIFNNKTYSRNILWCILALSLCAFIVRVIHDETIIKIHYTLFVLDKIKVQYLTTY